MREISLLDLWNPASVAVDPVFLLRDAGEWGPAPEALLLWGKVSIRTFEALQGMRHRGPLLGICPAPVTGISLERLRLPGRWIAGEHPLPGEASFEAGRMILDFFDSLRRYRVKRLRVFLSGGASSLAWLPPARMTREELLERLKTLYAAGLDIHELNARRSRLCQLKAGGAARWLSRLAPQVKTEVLVLSDVAPNGAQVVGSGPFWDGRISHRVIADNTTLVDALMREARNHQVPILWSSNQHGGPRLGSWRKWMQTAMQETAVALQTERNGLVILGGEPSVRLPVAGVQGRGGRQTQLALALSLELREWITQSRVEILAMSSDGSDGSSGAAGAYVNSRHFPRGRRHSLVQALRQGRSAAPLAEEGALVPSSFLYPHSNVQDVLTIRIHGKRLA